MASSSSLSSSSASSSQSMQIDQSTHQATKRKTTETSGKSTQYTLPMPNMQSPVLFSCVDKRIDGDPNSPTFRICIERASQQNIPYTVGWLGAKSTPSTQKDLTVLFFDGNQLYSCLTQTRDLSKVSDSWMFTALQKKILQSAQVTQAVFFATVYPGNTQFRPLPSVNIANLLGNPFPQNALPTYFRAVAHATDRSSQAASSATSLSSVEAADWYAAGNHYYHGANGMEKNSETAAFWWIKGANKRHADCSFGLACYFLDKFLDPDQHAKSKTNLKHSIDWLKEAAKQGHLKATHELAARYLENKAMSDDPTLEQRQLRGASWLIHAAKKENPEENPKSGFKAVTVLLPLAHEGNARAQYGLGLAYVDPTVHIIPLIGLLDASSSRLDQAIFWLEKAAAQGHPEATALLATAKEKRAKELQEHP